MDVVLKTTGQEILGEAAQGADSPVGRVAQAALKALEQLGFSQRECSTTEDWLTAILRRERPPIRVVSVSNSGISPKPAGVDGRTPVLQAFAIERGLSLAHMKSVVLEILSHLWQGDISPHFSPLYIPTLAPGFSIALQLKASSTNPQAKNDPQDWLDVGKAGMIHPNVFESVDYDSDIYTGFFLELRLDLLAWLRSDHP